MNFNEPMIGFRLTIKSDGSYGVTCLNPNGDSGPEMEFFDDGNI